MKVPVPVAARSKAYVCGRSPAEIVASNPTGGIVCDLENLKNEVMTCVGSQRHRKKTGRKYCYRLQP